VCALVRVHFRRVFLHVGFVAFLRHGVVWRSCICRLVWYVLFCGVCVVSCACVLCAFVWFCVCVCVRLFACGVCVCVCVFVRGGGGVYV